MSNSSVWHAARDLALTDTSGAIATISRQRGSLPMATDAKMLVTADGSRFGTIGGGCLEADVTGQALAARDAGSPALVRHTLNADDAGDIGLSCGGTAEFFLEPLVNSREMSALYASIGGAIDARATATIITALDWSHGPRKQVRIDDSVSTVGELNIGDLTSGVADAEASTLVDDERGLFVEVVRRVPRVIVFGAGHVGREIARVAATAGFHVVIADDREEFANPERVPWAHQVIARDFRILLDEMTFDEDDYVLATTRGHSFDAYVVERAAPSNARFVGMLGSKRKREVIWRALEAAGVPPEALRRVNVPLGEEIGADTPGEIAVAAVAQLIRVRRLGKRR